MARKIFTDRTNHRQIARSGSAAEPRASAWAACAVRSRSANKPITAGADYGFSSAVPTRKTCNPEYGGLRTDQAHRLKELERENVAPEEIGGGPRPGQSDAAGGALGKTVSPAARRKSVAHVREVFRVSERRACRVIRIARSSQRYRAALRGCRGTADRTAWWHWRPVWTLWVSPHHGVVTARRLARESQAGGADLAAGRAESAATPTETRAVVAERWFLCAPAPEYRRPCLEL